MWAVMAIIALAYASVVAFTAPVNSFEEADRTFKHIVVSLAIFLITLSIHTARP